MRAADGTAPTHQAYLNEIFLSAQGEGVLVGERQIFVRFAGCNIRCPWCDTPGALVAKDSPAARIEIAPGSGEFKTLANPVEPADVLAEVQRLARDHGPVRWVALTGGEPTVWRDFLLALLPGLRRSGLQVYLETNSHYPDTLRTILPWVDFVSADIKVPFADYEIPREKYTEFLALVPRGDLQVKVVVTADCPDEDVVEAARIAARVDREAAFILQPVTPQPGVAPEREGSNRAPAPAKLLDLQRRCLEVLERVRVIPQTHRIYGAL